MTEKAFEEHVRNILADCAAYAGTRIKSAMQGIDVNTADMVEIRACVAALLQDGADNVAPPQYGTKALYRRFVRERNNMRKLI